MILRRTAPLFYELQHRSSVLIRRSLSTADTQCFCWKCGAKVGEHDPCVLFCSKVSCRAIQRINPERCNFYNLFSIAEKSVVSIDLGMLESSYKNLQRLLHPDKYAAASLEEQIISSANSSIVNQGFQILKSKVDRINYALTTFYGIRVLEEGGSYQDASLMAEIFELREQVEDLRNMTGTDGNGKLKAASRLLKEVDDSLEALGSQLEVLIKNEKDFDKKEAITSLAVRFKYVTKARDEILERM